jgi:hypothetical protein
MPALVALGMGAFLLNLHGSAVTAIAIAAIAASLILLLVNPTWALFVLAATRFSFEMAWQYRIANLGILDFLGAGVPCGVVALLLLRRPQLAHIPLTRPVAGWVAVLWSLALIDVASGSDPLRVVESALRFTSGAAIFVLAALVVRRYEDALRLLLCWLAGTVPVAVVFFAYGDEGAMMYHGVQRLRALYHDPGTPAIVSSLGILSCICLLRTGRMLRWGAGLIVALAVWALVLSRVLFLTFSGALTASTFLALLTMALLERRWGLSLLTVLLVVGFFQIPSVQQRWFREAAIISGEEDVIAFASGRPYRWQRFLDRHDDALFTEKLVGIHGRWGNPENGLLHLLIDLGIIGTIATLLLLGHSGLSLFRWWREEEDPRVKLLHVLTLCIAVGYGAAWATGTPFTWVNYQWFLWSCLGACAALRARAAYR